VRAVCNELITRGPGDPVHWYRYVSPTPFSEELAELMWRAGCRGIDFGAESGTEEMLRALGRDFTPEDTVRAVRACRSQGIVVMLELLIGAPGETPQTARQSIEMARQSEPSCIDISLGVRGYAGTGMPRHTQERMAAGDSHGRWGRTDDNQRLVEAIADGERGA